MNWESAMKKKLGNSMAVSTSCENITSGAEGLVLGVSAGGPRGGEGCTQFVRGRNRMTAKSHEVFGESHEG